MAYILGLTFSDGSIYKTSLSWEIQIGDKELLIKLRDAMKSNYPIKVFQKRNSVRLRISNPLIIEDMKRLGFTTNGTLRFPHIPPEFLKHFIRGFLDGDGWIVADKDRMEICIGFSNGALEFLRELTERLNKHVFLTRNNLRKQEKITRKNKLSVTYKIEWYATNAFSILKFLYDDLKEDDLHLRRKYEQQLRAMEIYLEGRKSPKWREVERRYNMPMRELLCKLLIEEKLNGIQIAMVLGVDPCSVYRWLEKTKVRLPKKKEKKIFVTKCPVCGKQIERVGYSNKYCSRLCITWARQTGRKVRCAVCGRGLYRAQWWFKVNKVPFCSRACIGEWQKMRLGMNLIRRCEKSGRFLPSTSFQEGYPHDCQR